MTRAPFQILVLPYRKNPDGEFEFALFKRADTGFWQGIAGGGEDDETPLQAARRETREETGIDSDRFIRLDTTDSVPVSEFRDSQFWGEDIYVIPQHFFGLEVKSKAITLSKEHADFGWLTYEESRKRLHFDGNRTALWELHQRLQGRGPRG